MKATGHPVQSWVPRRADDCENLSDPTRTLHAMRPARPTFLFALVVLCAAQDVPEVTAHLVKAGEPEPRVIGEVTRGDGTVTYS